MNKICELCGSNNTDLVGHHDHACELVNLTRGLGAHKLQREVAIPLKVRSPRRWCRQCNSFEAKLKNKVRAGKGIAFSYFTFDDHTVKAAMNVDSSPELKHLLEKAYSEKVGDIHRAISILIAASEIRSGGSLLLDDQDVDRALSVACEVDAEVLHEVPKGVGKKNMRALNSFEKAIVFASIADEQRKYTEVPCNCCGRIFADSLRFAYGASGVGYPIRGEFNVAHLHGDLRALCAQCEAGVPERLVASNPDLNLKRSDVKPWLMMMKPQTDPVKIVSLAAEAVAHCGSIGLLSAMRNYTKIRSCPPHPDGPLRSPWHWNIDEMWRSVVE